MPWSATNTPRRDRLPREWHQLRGHVLKRDRYTCQLCGEFATHVDHIKRGDDDSERNLRALCAECHGKKSSAEGNAARVRIASTRRPREAHPSMLVERADSGTE